jgi:hypothetical protein
VVAVRADLTSAYASLNVPGTLPAAKMYFNNYLFERTLIDTSVNPVDRTTWTATTAPANTCYLTNVSIILTEINISNILYDLTSSGATPTTLPLELIVVKRALV